MNDKEFLQSPSHPDLANTAAPQTSSASRGNTRRCKHCTSPETENKRQAKEKRSDNLSVLHNNIKTCDERLALADNQKSAGKTISSAFILNRALKKIDEIIEITW